MRGSDGLVKEEARFLEKRGALAAPSHQADEKPCFFCMQMVDKRLERRICGESSREESGKNINKILEHYSYAEVSFADGISRAAAKHHHRPGGRWDISIWRWDGWNTPIPTSPTCPVQRLSWLVGRRKRKEEKKTICVIDQL
jgi:hypothetical protein